MGPLSNNLLNRPFSSLTPLQAQVDGWVGGFVQQATDWRSLAAMTAGGMAYRLGRVGVMATGAGRLASLGIGLSAEVTAFEMTNRSLSSLTGNAHFNPNLWKWEGQGGIRQGLLSSLITFGSLKGAGRLAQGETMVVQHLLQDTGMVLGHQVSGALGITPRPTGTLAEQFLHAETTLLQLGAGMALGRTLTAGRTQALEQGLDLSLRTMETNAGSRFPWPHIPSSRELAFAGTSVGRIGRSQGPEEIIKGPTLLKMSRLEGERDDVFDDDVDFNTLSQKAETDPDALEFLRILAAAKYEFAVWALGAAANRNPQAVFALRELAEAGNTLAVQNLRSLDISRLLELAKEDPEAFWAIRYLADVKHIDAVAVINGTPPSWLRQGIPIETSLFPAVSRTPFPFQRERWEQMAQEAETDPKVVSLLRKLADERNSRAEDILMNLNIKSLVAQAKEDLSSLYALCELAAVGHHWALNVLKYWDVSRLADQAQEDPKALIALGIIGQTGNQEALFLFTILEEKAQGEPSN